MYLWMRLPGLAAKRSDFTAHMDRRKQPMFQSKALEDRRTSLKLDGILEVAGPQKGPEI